MSEWITLVGLRGWRGRWNFASKSYSTDKAKAELHLWANEKLLPKSLPSKKVSLFKTFDRCAELLRERGGGVVAQVEDFGTAARVRARAVPAPSSVDGKRDYLPPTELMLLRRDAEPEMRSLDEEPIRLDLGDHVLLPVDQGASKALAGFRDLLPQLPKDLSDALRRPMGSPGLEWRVRRLELDQPPLPRFRIPRQLGPWLLACFLALLLLTAGFGLGYGLHENLEMELPQASPPPITTHAEAHAAEELQEEKLPPPPHLRGSFDQALGRLNAVPREELAPGLQPAFDLYRKRGLITKWSDLRARSGNGLILANLVVKVHAGISFEGGSTARFIEWLQSEETRLSLSNVRALIDLLLCTWAADVETWDLSTLETPISCDFSEQRFSHALSGLEETVEKLETPTDASGTE